MSNRSRSLWLLAGLLLVAANLRAPVTAVAPVLSLLQGEFKLSAAQAGLLTTLPLLLSGRSRPLPAPSRAPTAWSARCWRRWP